MRYIGAPRSVVNEAVSHMEGWKKLGERCLEEAKAACPVSEDTGDPRKPAGPHLRDTLRLKMIGGGDPRILVGSDQKGDVLGFVHDGTSAHEVPVPSGTLAFTPKGEGTLIFRRVDSVTIPAHDPNPFILEAMKKAVGGG